jgi:hypothetical protein
MAKKKADESLNPSAEPQEGLNPPEAPFTEGGQSGEEPVTAAGRPITDYVVIVNLTKMTIPCELRNGRSVNLGPRVPGMKIHKSEPILRGLLTPEIYLREKKRMLAIEPAGGV